ncbi:MAG: hypothetical protein Q8Q56_02925, partial [Alphaproteobacteria bacterium]|nr:hypothetical protein [Alphaproteobacteria bacterium]
MKGIIMLMMVGFLNPTLWGATESSLDTFKRTLSDHPTLEARSAYFKRLEPSQKEAIKYSLNSYVTNYESYNDFFHGMGSLCVQTIREKGYGDVFDVLVSSGDPFYIMLRAAEEYWNYCSTKEEAALDEATRLYQQTIEQGYPYTGAYLLGTLGGMKDGWA